MNRTKRRIVVAALFGLLVVVLLWFQGILFHHDHAPAAAPAPAPIPPSAARARVEARTVPGTLPLHGYVEAVDAAGIAPRVMATILTIGAREGDDVQAGAVLVELDDTEARARVDQAAAAVQAADSSAEAATLAWERAQRLREHDASTQQDWEAARSAHAVAIAAQARARAARTEAETNLGWYRLVAPFAGRVSARLGEPGQLALPGQPVLSLQRDDRVRFAVAVPAVLSDGVKVGDPATIAFDGLSDRPARVARVLPTTDPRTGTRTVHFELADVSGLQPGRMGRCELAHGTRTALVLPAGAVQRIGQIERVMLVSGPAPVPVIVRTGKTIGGAIEVLGGLRAGEEVLLP